MKVRRQVIGKIAILGLALGIALIFPVVISTQYYQHLAFLTFTYAATAVAWNIVGGYAGYISLGHSAFFGLGAYLLGLAATELGWNPFWTVPITALGVALFGLLVGLIALRTRGHAFVVVTIALVFIVQLIALNWRSLTGGMNGLQLPLAPYSAEFIKVPFYYSALALLILSIWISWTIKSTKFGLGLIAIREDEDKAEAVGVSTTLYKVLAFVISVYLVGMAGGIYAYYQTYIDPMFIFNIFFGVQMILMTILGGKGTLWGPVIGAFIMQPVADLILFRFGSSQLHLAIFGVLLLAFVVYLPRGILPTLGDYYVRFRQKRRQPAEELKQLDTFAERGGPAP